MKATRAALVAAAIALGSLIPANAAEGQRVEEAPYYGGSHISGQNWNVWIDGCIVVDDECVSSSAEFMPLRGERFVSVDVADDSGADVGATIVQDRKGKDTGYLKKSFCGATDRPIRLASRRQVQVYLHIHGCGSGSAAPPTHGVVTATFSR